jgi:transposase InsO family protein
VIEREKANFSIKRLCAAMNVSVSGYYAWRGRDKSERACEDERLTVQIEQIFYEFCSIYGAPRIQGELQDRGVRISVKRVARLMRQAGLSAELPPKRVTTTQRDDRHKAAENVLARDFSAERPNQKWVGDISYIPTASGWLYLAVIIDLYSRMVVGWATTLKTNILSVLTDLLSD